MAFETSSDIYTWVFRMVMMEFVLDCDGKVEFCMERVPDSCCPHYHESCGVFLGFAIAVSVNGEIARDDWK